MLPPRAGGQPDPSHVWGSWAGCRWQYKAPGAASFGPSGYQIRSVSIPEYGFGNGGGGGSGGNGGGGGGGGGGGNGDPMKGFTYLFGLLVFGEAGGYRLRSVGVLSTTTAPRRREVPQARLVRNSPLHAVPLQPGAWPRTCARAAASRCSWRPRWPRCC